MTNPHLTDTQLLDFLLTNEFAIVPDPGVNNFAEAVFQSREEMSNYITAFQKRELIKKKEIQFWQACDKSNKAAFSEIIATVFVSKMVDVSPAFYTDGNLLKIFQSLPDSIKNIAKHWRLSHPGFCNAANEWLFSTLSTAALPHYPGHPDRWETKRGQR